jgi:hypothetical protein
MATPICAYCGSAGRRQCCLQAAPNPAARPQLAQLLREKPRKVVAVALANKTARIVWALLAQRKHTVSPHELVRHGVSDKAGRLRR